MRELKRNFFTGFTVLLFAHSLLFSQQQGNYNIQSFTTEWVKVDKGLSQNTVFSVLQDSDGFLWAGTWDGLNKFDGYGFTFFRPGKDINGSSLSNETIRCLYEDEEGFLWIGTEKGLNRMNRYTYEIKVYRRHSNNTNSISSDTIYAISGNKNGIIYIGTNNGLNIYDKRTGVFTVFHRSENKEKGLCCNTVNCLYADRSAFLWVGTNKGLNIIDLISGDIKSYNRSDDGPLIPSDTVLSISGDTKGNVWVGTVNGLSKIKRNRQDVVFYRHEQGLRASLSHNAVSAVYCDKSGHVWVGTYGGGLNLFDEISQSFSQIRNVQGRLNSLSSDFIHSISEDRFGNIWIAAWKGLSRLEMNTNNFNHYYHIQGKSNTLSNNIIWHIFEDDDSRLWIATEDGINIYNRRSGEFSYIRHNSNIRNTLSSNQVRTIFKDSEGLYWIGTFNNGLNVYDRKNNIFTYYVHEPENPQSIVGNQIWHIVEDHHGDLWIATFSGLSRFNRADKTFTNIRYSAGQRSILPDNQLLHLYIDNCGLLWISTFNGLSVYDIDSHIYTHYKAERNTSSALSNNRVFSVAQDSRGYYWIATMGGGLNKYDMAANQFENFTTADGLANDIVYNVLEDNMGNLWISTNNGLSYYNIRTENFVNYDIRDGIQSSEFNLGAACRTQKGEIAFGGMNGFNLFFPDEFTTNIKNPNVVVTAFRIFDNYIPKQLKNNDTIVLKYYENFFGFEFAALDLSQNMKNKYAYILEGFNKDWVYTDAVSRIAEFTNVPPGSYYFRVRGTNNTGSWSDNEVSILVVIKQAWFKTWWFYSLLALLFVSITAAVLIDRYRKIRRKHQLDKKMLAYEKQVFQLRQKALSTQMNPHFIFNTLNAIQNFILKNNTDKAVLYMGKLSQLMRLILNSTSDIYFPLIDEIKVVTHYLELEKIRFDNKFDYTIQIDEDIDSDFCGIPPMILQPFVENALLHGILQKENKGHIHIVFKTFNAFNLICIIEDDGIGREKAMQIRKESGMMHRSRGISITTDRLNLFEKLPEENDRLIIEDLENDKGESCGTRVRIVLPFIEL